MKRLFLVLFSLTVFSFWTPSAFAYGPYCPNGGIFLDGRCVQPAPMPTLPIRPGYPQACPHGTVRQGNRCVRPGGGYDRPQRPNYRPRPSACPRGTVKRGHRCVPRHRPHRPNYRPNYRPQPKIIKKRVCNAYGCRIIHKRAW